MKMQKLENIGIGLKILTDDGIKLVNIGQLMCQFSCASVMAFPFHVGEPCLRGEFITYHVVIFSWSA